MRIQLPDFGPSVHEEFPLVISPGCEETLLSDHDASYVYSSLFIPIPLDQNGRREVGGQQQLLELQSTDWTLLTVT